MGKSEPMVTMDDLMAFDDEEEKVEEPVAKKPKEEFTVQNQTVQLAVQALEQIKSSSGDNMFNLLERFLNTHRIGKSFFSLKCRFMNITLFSKAYHKPPVIANLTKNS